ncbi:exosortase K [Pedobacter fastidiosus]|uniref:Exosortase K n=1 Tax=Pedobacter fastidiosus TaxID=2765361 RepID=A0ABR7KPL3_9SPHI|nr:exosortase K [Pedobacter fastidiosus]MBC6110020.1 exosortase K [Pedobacter fastidiosus]
MKKINNNFFYSLGLFTLLILKYFYATISTQNLNFILGPTNYFLSLIIGSKGTYIQNLGYYHSNLNITIEKACSGFNFMLISFLVTYCLLINHFKNQNLKMATLPITLFFGWVLTIFVNVSRITSSIFINKFIAFPKPYQSLIHQSEGTFIYLFFLISSYKLINYLLNKYAVQNEKLA